VWGRLVRAAIHAQKGHHDAAIAELHEAVKAAEKGEMLSCAAAARSRLAMLGSDGKAELGAAVDRWIAAEEIADPKRILEVVAPGFPG
jgi:hypothetical protein